MKGEGRETGRNKDLQHKRLFPAKRLLKKGKSMGNNVTVWVKNSMIILKKW